MLLRNCYSTKVIHSTSQSKQYCKYWMDIQGLASDDATKLEETVQNIEKKCPKIQIPNIVTSG